MFNCTGCQARVIAGHANAFEIIPDVLQTKQKRHPCERMAFPKLEYFKIMLLQKRGSAFSP